MEELPVGTDSVSVESRFLTRAEFRRLSDVPPEAEWFANIDNANTRQAYRNDVGDFIRFVAIEDGIEQSGGLAFAAELGHPRVVLFPELLDLWVNIRSFSCR